MELHYQSFGDGPPLVILHGFLGSSDNWQSLAKKLASEFKVILPDQRNHGQSPWSEEWNYEKMAEDLDQLLLDLNVEACTLIGHSMGGKVAMWYSSLYPQKVKKLSVVDIAPKAYPIQHDYILDALLNLPLADIKSRKDADQLLSTTFSQLGLRQFLLKNMGRDEQNKFYWKANLQVFRDQIAHLGIALPDDWNYAGPTLFIKGEKSDYILKEDEKLIGHHFPAFKLESIAGAGHWVHAEQPAAFFEVFTAYIKS